MAQTLGTLIVKLGLDAIEFTTGLTRSEAAAAKLAKKLDAELRTAAIAAGAALATIGAAGLVAAKGIVAEAAALDDLADATGSSVENLSRLANQAKISGTSFETLQGLMLKLSAGMAGADDESSNVGRALAYLGVTAKDPAEALNQVALALDKYADGTSKAALARDLFGKGGPAFLATLKDIAQAQDVAATVTAKQAAEAENLEKALRRLSVEGTTFKNLVLNDMVPAVTKLLEQFTDGIRIAGSFGTALRLFSFLPMVSSVDDAYDALTKLNERINSIEQGQGLEGITARLTGQTARIVEDLKKQRAFLELQLRQQIDATTGKKGGAADDLTIKPKANYTGASEKKAAAGADDFARALESVRKMAAGAQYDLDALGKSEAELTHAQRALALLQADDVWQKFTETQRQQLKAAYESVSAIENQTTAQKKLREEYDAYIKSLQEAAAAETKARDAARSKVADYAAQNDVLGRQLAIVGQDQLAHEKLAAALEYERTRRQLVEANALDQVAAYDKEYQARLRLIEAIDSANKALEEQRKAKQYADDLGEAFGRAAEEAIAMGRSAKEVLKGLEQDLLRLITRQLVTKPLAGAISDWLSGGSGAGLFSLFGGGVAGASAYQAGGFASVDTSPFLGFAAGTNSAPGGWSIVGERGPEAMFVPRGAQIIPHERLMEKRSERLTIQQTINVLPGATRQSVSQAANEMTRSLMRAHRNS